MLSPSVKPEAPQSKQPVVVLLVVSVLLHIGVIAILAQDFTVPAKKQKPENTIKATLVFPSIPAPPPDVEIKAQQPPEVIPPQQKPAPPPAELASTPEQPVEKTEPIEQVQVEHAEQKESAIQTTPRRMISASELAREHLQSVANTRQKSLAQQQSQEYRQNKDSPILTKKPSFDFKTEDEKLLESAQVKVDCSSTTNKALAMLSGIAGGMLKCSKPPPFDSFIQNRINKNVPDEKE